MSLTFSVFWLLLFRYLQSEYSSNDHYLDARTASASSAFAKLKPLVFKNKNISIEAKRAAYVACVLTILMYGSECWALTKRMRAKLATFHNMAARMIYGCQWRHVREQHITTVTVLKETGLRHIDTYLERRRIRWAGHVARMGISALKPLFRSDR